MQDTEGTQNYEEINESQETTTENQEHNVAESKNQSLPSFEEVIASYKEKARESLQSEIHETITTVIDPDSNISGNWEISATYGLTKWTLWFDYSWAMDKTLENILWLFKFSLLLQNWKELTESLPNTLDLWISFKVFLEKVSQYIQFWDFKFDWLEEALLEDEYDEKMRAMITKIKEFLNGKWIEINKENLCNESSEQYSEDGCEMAEWISEYMTTLSWLTQNQEEFNEQSEELLKVIKSTMQASIQSVFSPNVLIDSELTQYKWKQAYKFWLNERALKRNMKKVLETLGTYSIEKSVKTMQEINDTYPDEYAYLKQDLDEYKQEQLADIKDSINDLLNKISIKEFVGYLVYDETTQDFDLVIEKLHIFMIEEESVYNPNYNYLDENSDEEMFITEEKEYEIDIVFSTLTKVIGIVVSEEGEAKAKIVVKYSNTDDTNSVTINFSFDTGETESITEDLIVLSITDTTKNDEKEKLSDMQIKMLIKKELLYLDNDIEISIKAKSHTTMGENFRKPDVSNAISFKEFENFVDELEEESWVAGESRDTTRKWDLSLLGSLLLSYYNEKWEYPKVEENKMVEVSSISNVLEEINWMGDIPSDPLEENSFEYNGSKIGNWSYGYMLTTKNSIPKAWFVLMAKTETPEHSNYVAWIKIPNDLSKFSSCETLVKGTTMSTSVPENGECTYTSEDDLRYVYVF